ncbi:MAG: flagellar hook protein FlgE [Armatimonadota bacterium]
MIQAMFSGISGMRAFKSSLDVIGNNIANVNTTAYKAARSTFKEALAQTIKSPSGPTDTRGGVNPSQIGLGTIFASVDLNMNQGSLMPTGRPTDLAIDGAGMFVVANGTRMAFTRDGAFELDAQNNLVSSGTGMKVLGWNANLNTFTVDTSQAVTANSGINIPVGDLSIARATTALSIGGNLDASSAVGEIRTVDFDVYDSLGITHRVSAEFELIDSAINRWQCRINCPDAGGVVYTTNINFDAQGNCLTNAFNVSMTLTTPNGSVDPIQFSVNPLSMSQLNGKHTADLTYQDGLPLGVLESFSIDQSGIITGTFTNGVNRVLGQIAVASFSNPAGLAKQGGNLWAETPNSGNAQIGVADTGGRGTIKSNHLEASNVDLAREFADMIIAQRGFQASSRVITASDQVLQELVQMVR